MRRLRILPLGQQLRCIRLRHVDLAGDALGTSNRAALHTARRKLVWSSLLRHTVKFFNGVGDPVGRYPRLYLRRAVLFRQSRGNVRRS